MRAYITREDAFKVLTEYYHHKTPEQDAALLEALSRVPAEDITPVVRCEDCVFWVANEDFDGWGWCCNSAIGEKDREENFFCAYGAKKE